MQVERFHYTDFNSITTDLLRPYNNDEIVYTLFLMSTAAPYSNQHLDYFYFTPLGSLMENSLTIL